MGASRTADTTPPGWWGLQSKPASPVPGGRPGCPGGIWTPLSVSSPCLGGAFVFACCASAAVGQASCLPPLSRPRWRCARGRRTGRCRWRPQNLRPFWRLMALCVGFLNRKDFFAGGVFPVQVAMRSFPCLWHHLQRQIRSASTSSWESEYEYNRTAGLQGSRHLRFAFAGSAARKEHRPQI